MPTWNPVKSLARDKPDAGSTGHPSRQSDREAKKAERPHQPNPNAKKILTDGSQLPSNNPF